LVAYQLVVAQPQVVDLAVLDKTALLEILAAEAS
jgi:hypothetical protein